MTEDTAMRPTTEGEVRLSPVKQALIEIRELRAKLKEAQSALNQPIAVIGMGMRFPGGADDPDTFWRLLRDGVDAIREVPPDRWDVNAYYDPDPNAPGKMSTRWGGFLESIDRFDPEFFGISPREAMTMDPQQRLLLEVVWESLENAGRSPAALFGSLTGVFIGIASFDYLQDQIEKAGPGRIDAYLATGSIHSIASGRISYVLGLRGPSVSIDTACSSSLVAVHQACQSLRTRECDMALAGGVNVILRPEFHINFSKSHVLSADGRCKAFDAGADGFVRSEGCGIVVLKRLSDALAGRDRILAVIRGSAVNQDGRSSGLTAPNGPSQQDVIRRALAQGGVRPPQVQYIEAHGTGTELGDPIEVQALAEVFGADRAASDPLLIGSVKTNIGHLETAAGVAGLIKLVLALRNGEIPPHLHLKRPNPHIPWENIPVRVPAEGVPWPSNGSQRIGGVSSFGFSGTNAHIVVEAYSSPVRAGNDHGEGASEILTLSGRTESALQEQVNRFAKYFGENSNDRLDDACYSANTGRTHFEHRMALVAGSMRQVIDKLRSARHGAPVHGLFYAQPSGLNAPEAVFLFSGRVRPYVNMGRRLYLQQPVFRRAVDHCCDLLQAEFDRPLQSVFYPESDARSDPLPGEHGPLGLFILDYALAELWRSWGIAPAAVMGDAFGEYTAACVAGVFSLEEGLRLVLGKTRGTPAAVEMKVPRIPMMSGVSGDLVASDQLSDPEYWGTREFDAAGWANGLRSLWRKGYRLFVELGPDAHLSIIGRERLPDLDSVWVPSLEQGTNDWNQILCALAAVHTQGAAVDWEAFYAHRALEKVVLPAYPFQRDRYWFEPSGDYEGRRAEIGQKPQALADGRHLSDSPTGGQVENDGHRQPPPAEGALSGAVAPLDSVAVAQGLLRDLRGTSKSQQKDMLIELVRSAVMKVLHRDRSKEVKRHQRLMDFGIDSLMAVELRTIVRNSLGLASDLPATLIYDYPTVEAIADYIVKSCLTVEADVVGGNSASSRAMAGEPQESQNVSTAGLSEAEMERLLLAKLDELEEEK
jgi:acyl transferase domain-containing protein